MASLWVRRIWLRRSFSIPAQHRITIGMDEYYAPFAGQV